MTVLCICYIFFRCTQTFVIMTTLSWSYNTDVITTLCRLTQILDKKWCQLMPAGIRLHECLFRFMSGVMKSLFRGYVALWTLTLTWVLASFWRLHLFSLDSTQRDLEKRTGTLEEPYSEFLQNSLVIFYLYRYLTDPSLRFCAWFRPTNTSLTSPAADQRVFNCSYS